MSKETDSVKTPMWLKRYITKKYGKWFDPTPYRPKWDAQKNFDALNHEWKGKVVYMNPPYSNAKPFLERAVEQKKSGRTIIILVKVDIMMSKYWATIVSDIYVFFSFIRRSNSLASKRVLFF